MIILAIETSCDETAISIVKAEGDLENLDFQLLGSVINSQIKIHEVYGGVFPTLAKREHIKNLPIVYKQTIEEARIKENEIDVVVVTTGPGLEPALWTGINFAKELGEKMKKEVLGVNHMLGHIASVLLTKKTEIDFPALALLVSGGHTELIVLKNWGDKEKIGETKDDAAGEAFDKVARMLGLSYPGGPQVSAIAEEARKNDVKISSLKFPRPMMHTDDFDFSFSGLKTAVLYYIKSLGDKNDDKTKMTIAREFEDAVIDVLIHKTKKAIDRYAPQTLVVGGGVIANKRLREEITNLNKTYPQIKILIPEKNLTTDNATMIAIAGYIEYLKNKEKIVEKELEADGNLEL